MAYSHNTGDNARPAFWASRSLPGYECPLNATSNNHRARKTEKNPRGPRQAIPHNKDSTEFEEQHVQLSVRLLQGGDFAPGLLQLLPG